MKCYLIARRSDGKLRLTCQALVKGKLLEEFPAGPFDIGNDSEEAKALAWAILSHYFGTDAGGQAEVERRADAFLRAFLVHHSLAPGAQLEIGSEVIDRFIFLLQVPVQAR